MFIGLKRIAKMFYLYKCLKIVKRCKSWTLEKPFIYEVAWYSQTFMEKVSRAFFEKATNILASASLVLKQPKDFSIKVREASYVNNETGSPPPWNMKKVPPLCKLLHKK